MAYGISVSNTGGSVLIDQEYISLYEKESGTISTTGSPGSGEEFPDFVNVPANYDRNTDVLAIQGQKAGMRFFLASALDGDGLRIGCWGTAGNIKYKLFSRMDTDLTPSNNYGLEVFNEAGDVVFSSNEKYPRVEATYTGQSPVSNTQVSTSNVVWAVLGGTEMYRVYTDAPNTRFAYQTVECHRVDGTGNTFYRPLNYETYSSFSYALGDIGNNSIKTIVFLSE